MTTATMSKPRQMVDVTPSTTTVTMSASAFKRAVVWGTHCASKDEYLPALTSVLITLHAPKDRPVHFDKTWDVAGPVAAEGTLVSLATTDRYRLAWTTLAPLTEPVASGDEGAVEDSILVDAALLAKAAKAFKIGRNGESSTATLTIHRDVTGEREVIVEFTDPYNQTSSRIVLDEVRAEFPKYKSLIPTQFEENTGTTALSVNPTLLAAMCTAAKASVDKGSLRMQISAGYRQAMYTTRPICVAPCFNDNQDDVHMSALLMPIRLTS